MRLERRAEELKNGAKRELEQSKETRVGRSINYGRRLANTGSRSGEAAAS
jgi:hypothetical protein